jgi:preprotein translocase subunit SecA
MTSQTVPDTRPARRSFSIKKSLSGHGRNLKGLNRSTDLVLAQVAALSALTDTELADHVAVLRARAAEDGFEATAVDGLAAAHVLTTRHLNMTPYRVQILAALVLLQGSIAQMSTGEGKTLVAGLASFAAGLEGRGTHVITPNDYLAARDAALVAPMFEAVGMSVGVVTEFTPVTVRRDAYACDVTYVSDSQVAFDYLRDHTFANAASQQVHRGLHVAIVDEVDAVLLDHAKTPLILTSTEDLPMSRWLEVNEIVSTLTPGTHVVVDYQERVAHLTSEGTDLIEERLGFTEQGSSLYEVDNVDVARIVRHLLTAAFVFEEGRDYIIEELDGVQQVSIIDATTGRTLVDNVWTDGLHQAVEISHGLTPRPEQHTWARITYQAFFGMYDHLCGMSGTAITEAEEFATAFDLHCTEVPTNRPLIREDAPDQVFASRRVKLAAIVRDTAAAAESDRPVLIGCATVEAAEELSKLLNAAGVTHRLLTARNPESEADVIAQAGQAGAVTVSTAMAGRGTDILLGGDPALLARAEIAAAGLDPDNRPEDAAQAQRILATCEARCAAEAATVRACGGLYVIGAERFEARRIDNQLRGRSGRQGDPGASRFYVCPEDEMVSIFGAASQIISTIVSADRPVSSKSISKMVERAQKAMEGRDVSSRGDLMKWDYVLDEQRNEFYRARDRWVAGEEIWERVDKGAHTLAVGLIENYLLIDPATTEDPEGFGPKNILATLKIDPAGLDPARLHEFYSAMLDADQDPEPAGLLLAEIIRTKINAAADVFGGRTDPQITRLMAVSLLALFDRAWREHLAFLDHLRTGIKLRRTLGSDPVYAWANEAEEAWSDMSRTTIAELAWAGLSLRDARDTDTDRHRHP